MMATVANNIPAMTTYHGLPCSLAEALAKAGV
jgi:hypothetical protein